MRISETSESQSESLSQSLSLSLSQRLRRLSSCVSFVQL